MNLDKIEEYVKKVPLFNKLLDRDIREICKIMVHRSYKTGEYIVHQEDSESQTFFIIASGLVHVEVLTAEGKNTILATLKEGEFFGEMAILDDKPRSASVVATKDCELLMLRRRDFLNIIEKYPRIPISMLIAMSHRLRLANRHINTLSLMSVYGRVADVLLRIAKDHGVRVGNVIVVHDRPTHNVIAEMAGTSRETVSRVLSQLQKKHYITIDRKKMVILNEEELYS